MAPDPYQRTNGTASPAGATSTPPDSSYLRLQLDNLLRRELRVSDPGDPKLVAEALLTRYQNTPRARAIEQEARGLPVLPMPSLEAPPTQQEVASSKELEQGKEDVRRDLQSLLNNALIKDIQPELRGWQAALDRTIVDGTNAARFALDARQRDRAFAARRLLGDYARMARLIGTMTPSLSPDYRRLAQSLDEVSSVILVMMGEALANVGFGGSRFILQVPASELQQRREAVLSSLRNLTGSVQYAYGQEEWPRGLHAYRALLKALDDSGHSDLRALFNENHIARLMDDLISHATTPTADGLRALGSTATLAVQSLRRLVRFAQAVVDPLSPPLSAFLIAQQLFFEAFTASTSGYRLLYIARPAVLYYGLYGLGGPDASRDKLSRLLLLRGQLAEELDCGVECACTKAEKVRQVLVDKILLDVDRAIDYYALSAGDGSISELRAAVFAKIIDTLLHPSSGGQDLRTRAVQAGVVDRVDDLTVDRRIKRRIRDIQLALDTRLPVPTSEEWNSMLQEICMHIDAEDGWLGTVASMAPSCLRTQDLIGATKWLLWATRVKHFHNAGCNKLKVGIPADVSTVLTAALVTKDTQAGI